MVQSWTRVSILIKFCASVFINMVQSWTRVSIRIKFCASVFIYQEIKCPATITMDFTTGTSSSLSNEETLPGRRTSLSISRLSWETDWSVISSEAHWLSYTMCSVTLRVNLQISFEQIPLEYFRGKCSCKNASVCVSLSGANER